MLFKDVTFMLGPGVYILYDSGNPKPLYIGSSAKLSERLAQHMQGRSVYRDGMLLTIKFDKVKVLPYRKDRMLFMEKKLIQKMKPLYNVALPNVTSYNTVITSETILEVDQILEEIEGAHHINWQNGRTTMLYNAKSTKNHEIIEITKFDEDFNVENVYLVGPRSCECQGFERAKRCRHTQMFTMFRVKKAVNTDWFLNFDSREWQRHAEVAVGNGQMLVDRVVERSPDDLVIGEAPSPAPEVAPASGAFRFRRFT